jgi:hypothetical protein
MLFIMKALFINNVGKSCVFNGQCV